MEYSLEDLYKAVYFTLTLNNNKIFQLDELYQEIIKNNTCPELSEIYYTRSNNILINACTKASEKYNNVFFNGKQCYLNTNANEYYKNDIIETIKNPELNFTLEKIYPNGQTSLHFLCMINDTELLNKLSKSFYFDLMMKNEAGQTVLDMIQYDNKELVECLLKIMVCQSNKYQNKCLLEETKTFETNEENCLLINKNRALINEINRLKLLNTKIENENIDLIAKLEMMKNNNSYNWKTYLSLLFYCFFAYLIIVTLC